jgi:hypothetical protein
VAALRVLRTSKPPQAIAAAEAVVEVTGSATWDEVVDAGLAALHEPKDGLFGFGIRQERKPGVTITDRTVVVYANRD